MHPCSSKNTVVDIVRDFKKIEAQMLKVKDPDVKHNQIVSNAPSNLELSEMDSPCLENSPLNRQESI